MNNLLIYQFINSLKFINSLLNWLVLTTDNEHAFPFDAL